MNFTAALGEALLLRDLPIISYYDFFVLGHDLFRAKCWQNEQLKRMPRGWDHVRAKSAIQRLEKKSVLIPDTDFLSNIWRVTQATRAGSAEEVICLADPFAYVSHLSAMQKYGLTNRTPLALHMTTPKRTLWNALRDKIVQRDLLDLTEIGKPILNRQSFKSSVRRRPVIMHVSSHPWTPSPISGEETRITSIGQTFADMLTEPALCGGMGHVLNVWENEAEQWLSEIIPAIDMLESKIAKVRAGYILSERMGIDHPILQHWEQYAQRGGSRKLDPDADYIPKFSERWMISINA